MICLAVLQGAEAALVEAGAELATRIFRAESTFSVACSHLRRRLETRKLLAKQVRDDPHRAIMCGESAGQREGLRG